MGHPPLQREEETEHPGTQVSCRPGTGSSLPTEGTAPASGGSAGGAGKVLTSRPPGTAHHGPHPRQPLPQHAALATPSAGAPNPALRVGADPGWLWSSCCHRFCSHYPQMGVVSGSRKVPPPSHRTLPSRKPSTGGRAGKAGEEGIHPICPWAAPHLGHPVPTPTSEGASRLPGGAHCCPHLCTTGIIGGGTRAPLSWHRLHQGPSPGPGRLPHAAGEKHPPHAPATQLCRPLSCPCPLPCWLQRLKPSGQVAGGYPNTSAGVPWGAPGSRAWAQQSATLSSDVRAPTQGTFLSPPSAPPALLGEAPVPVGSPVSITPFSFLFFFLHL